MNFDITIFGQLYKAPYKASKNFQIALKERYKYHHETNHIFSISQLSKQKFFEYPELKNNYHLFSLRSKFDTETTFSISFIEEGLKIQQEKFSMSEMFIIKFNLFNLQWHQIALR